MFKINTVTILGANGTIGSQCAGIIAEFGNAKIYMVARDISKAEDGINPSGGLIGCGHPFGASGVRMLLDLHKQITKTVGDYQIKKANNAMMLNIGGSATTNFVFIVSKLR